MKPKPPIPDAFGASSEREPHYAVDATPLPEIPRFPLHVVLDNIRSAYNVGSMFRTADACAVEHLHLCGMTAHPPHKKLEKTALGAFAYVPWTYHERTKDCLGELREQGVHIVAAEIAPGAVSLPQMHWPKPCALVVGNEVTGINEKTLARCDAVVTIPMHGYKNSINVATAFGILLHTIVSSWHTSASAGSWREEV